MTRRSLLSLTASLPLAGLAVAYTPQDAKKPMKRKSPHETVSISLGNDNISIVYGRPYLKGRQLATLTPFGKVWRLGADEATKLTVTAKTTIGPLDLAPGSYSLFAITGADKWTIIVNKTADQWGAFKYQESEDQGRFDAPVEKTPSPVEEFTISLTKESDTSAKLNFSWGEQSVTTTVKSA